MHFFTDQLRVDPGWTDSQFAGYLPVPPLAYNEDLGAAARFYADDMAENGCFPADHSSCDGTPFGERVASFYSGSPTGENIALGYSGAHSVVYEGWLYSDGHRENMLSAAWNELGTGFPTEDPTKVYVQDFGGGGLAGQPITTSGTHYPLHLEPEDLGDFYVAVHDPEGSPSSARLVLDGEAHSMNIDRGSATMLTYSVAADAGEPRCAEYYFVVTRVTGEAVYYPSTGSLHAPIGDVSCEAWTERRIDADALGGEGDDTPAGLGGDGQGCGASGDPNEALGAEDAAYGTCTLGGGSTSPLALAMLLLGLSRRRRRQLA